MNQPPNQPPAWQPFGPEKSAQILDVVHQYICPDLPMAPGA